MPGVMASLCTLARRFLPVAGMRVFKGETLHRSLSQLLLHEIYVPHYTKHYKTPMKWLKLVSLAKKYFFKLFKIVN